MSVDRKDMWAERERQLSGFFEKLCPEGDITSYVTLAMYASSSSDVVGALAVSLMFGGTLYNTSRMMIESLPPVKIGTINPQITQVSSSSLKKRAHMAPKASKGIAKHSGPNQRNSQ